MPATSRKTGASRPKHESRRRLVRSGRSTPARPAKRKAAAVGGPSKFTPKNVQAIIEAIEDHGASPSGAGRVLGIHPQTVSDWRDRYPEFSDEIEAAYERRRQRLLKSVEGSKDGARWILEREYR